MPRFAIKTPPQHARWSDILEIWKAADQIDLFESAWLFDHFYPIIGDQNGPCLESWVTLTALSQATSRLRIGSMVNGMHSRHPAITAKMAATLMIDFLLSNSIRFYAETIDGGAHSALSRWVAGYILSAKLETIARRDLMRINRQFSKNPKAITATMNALYAANWVEEAHTKRTGEVTSWAVNPKVHIKFQRLAAAERERRAEERKKIEQVVEVFRRSRVSR